MREKLQALTNHWMRQRLVPISQVGRQPYRSFCLSLRGPLTVWQVQEWSNPPVLLGRILPVGHEAMHQSANIP